MLIRLIHNALHTLKKDSGAHFTYNIGVGFVRAGFLLMAAAALIFSWFHFKPFVRLRYIEETNARVIGYWRVNVNYSEIEWINEHFAKYRYYIVLEYERFGSVETLYEYVSEETFKEIEELAGLAEHDVSTDGIPLKMKLYDTDRRLGYLYLSQKNASEAAAECRAAFPPDSAGNTAVGVLLLVSVPLILIGLKQERLAMKYPRTDVEEIGSTALSAVSGTDIPSDDPPLADEDELYRLEENVNESVLFTDSSRTTGG